MKLKLKNFIQLFFLLFVILFTFFYTKKNLNDFKKILDLSLVQFLVLTMFTFAVFILNAYIFNIGLKIFKINLKTKEWFSIHMLNNYSNYLFAKGGFIMRSFYLKKKHSLSYTKYLTLFLFINILIALSSTCVIFINFLFNNQNKELLRLYFILISIMFFVILNIPLFLPKKIFQLTAKKFPKLSNILFSWLEVRKNKKIALLAILLIFIMLNVSALKIYLIYNMIFSRISYFTALTIVAFSFMSPYLSITPAALGVREGLMTIAASLNGENVTTASAVAILDRGVIMLWVFIIGFLLSLFFYKKNLF